MTCIFIDITKKIVNYRYSYLDNILVIWAQHWIVYELEMCASAISNTTQCIIILYFNVSTRMYMYIVYMYKFCIMFPKNISSSCIIIYYYTPRIILQYGTVNMIKTFLRNVYYNCDWWGRGRVILWQKITACIMYKYANFGGEDGEHGHNVVVVVLSSPENRMKINFAQ